MLPLLVSAGVINSGKTFPTGFSYCPSEGMESYQFFFQSIKETAFVGDIQLPRVIIGDQAGGLIAAIDSPSPKPFSREFACGTAVGTQSTLSRPTIANLAM